MGTATAADSVWNALGDPTRRQVFRLLGGGERSVGELATEVPVSRPAVSQHLRVLKEAQLVIDRPDGVRRLYSVRRTGLEALRHELETMWDDALAAFADAADAPARESRSRADRDGRRRR